MDKLISLHASTNQSVNGSQLCVINRLNVKTIGRRTERY